MSSQEIEQTLGQFQIRLTADEALAIQNDFLKRPPTYAECILWSIQGSEHCSYKSSRKHLSHFITDAPQVILGPKEDSGIVSVATDRQGRRYGIVMSHESHNHPSQVVPYEGAATGVGGNVRDVSCMGAKVIAVADSLRFGRYECAKTQWIQDGVTKGIAGYANPLGIPNLAGDVCYDHGYDDNCLVTVVTLGVVREEDVIHSHAPVDAEDYRLILVGKPTDNSGFGGAAFASSTLDEQQSEANKGAVQEPNAFLQRHIIKANEALFAWLKEKQLIARVGFKDLGAGGIACASVELADAGGYGAVVELEPVPVSMANLMPEVVLCSETQERFMWAVPQTLVEHVLTHYNQRFALPQICDGAQATVVGRITRDKRYIVNYKGKKLIDANAGDITQGILYDRPYNPIEPQQKPHPRIPEVDLNQELLALLAHENIACRSPIYETYDKQVQGRTIFERGQADAGLLAPFNDDSWPEEIQKTGVALAVAHNPRFCRMNPYLGAMNAVVEAIRQVVAVGCWPYALTDCLCFGNPENPEQMGEFVAAVHAITEVCKAVTLPKDKEARLPIISGNVSLYNDSARGAIPPSPMISCLGRMDDYDRAVTPDFKARDSVLIVIGQRDNDCGGSIFFQRRQLEGGGVPKPDLTALQHELEVVHDAAQSGLILSAKTIGRGGIAVALAQMAFKANLGVQLTHKPQVPMAQWLFAESGGFVLEIEASRFETIKQKLTERQVAFTVIGHTTDKPQLMAQGGLNLALNDAFSAWKQGLQS